MDRKVSIETTKVETKTEDNQRVRVVLSQKNINTVTKEENKSKAQTSIPIEYLIGDADGGFF